MTIRPLDTHALTKAMVLEKNKNGRVINGVTHSQKQVVYVTRVTSLRGGSYTVTITPGIYFTNIRSGQSQSVVAGVRSERRP